MIAFNYFLIILLNEVLFLKIILIKII